MDHVLNIDPKTGDIYITYKALHEGGSTTDYVMRIAYDDLNLNDRTFTGYLWSSDGAEVDDFWFNRYNGNAKAATRGTDKGKTHWKVVMTAKSDQSTIKMFSVHPLNRYIFYNHLDF